MSGLFWALTVAALLVGSPLVWPVGPDGAAPEPRKTAASPTDAGNGWDPNGQPLYQAGNGWDPDGQPQTEAGNGWDPNG